MSQTRLALMASLLTAAAAAPVAAQPLPEAASILDRYVEATGGAAAYAKVKSFLISGAVEMAPQGLTGTVTMYAAPPNLQLNEVELAGIGRIESGVGPGNLAWENSAMRGARVKAGEEQASALRQAAFHGATRWREMFASVETMGLEGEGDAACYRVKLTPKQGSHAAENCYSKSSGLLARTRLTVPSPMGDLPVEIAYLDYRVVEGIKLPFRTVRKTGGQTVTTVVERATANADIAAGKFTPPEAVRALAAPATAPKPQP